jgi:outer membrane biosynthesis protein TonB
MTDAALLPVDSIESQIDAMPIQPKWLRPAAIAAAVAFHVSIACLFLLQPAPVPESLDGIGVDLEQGDADVTQEEQEKQEEVKQMETPDEELAAPPPLVMAPESPSLPLKRNDAEPTKKHVEQKVAKQNSADQRATTRGGAVRSHGAGGVQSASARAAFLRSIKTQLMIHRPATGEAGVASVCFSVSAGGSVSVGSASGANAAAARRAVASIHPIPDATGKGYYGCQTFNFH